MASPGRNGIQTGVFRLSREPVVTTSAQIKTTFAVTGTPERGRRRRRHRQDFRRVQNDVLRQGSKRRAGKLDRLITWCKKSIMFKTT